MKKLLSKEKFCEYVNHIIELNSNSEILEKALQLFADDMEFTGFYFSTEFDIEFLENLLEDDNHWISWWIFEARENPIDCIECDGKKWTLRTASDLYDFLFQEEEIKPNEYYKGGKFSIEFLDDVINKSQIENKKLINKRTKEENQNANDYVKFLKLLRKGLQKELANKGVYIISNE